MKKNPGYNLFKTIIFITTFLIGATSAYANEANFTVYPTYMHQDNKNWIIGSVQQGKDYNDLVTLENLTDKKQKIALTIREATNNNNEFNVVENETFKDIGHWIVLPQNYYNLGPKEKMKIPFQIKIPNDVPTGKYQAVIYAANEQSASSQLKIVTRIGVRIYLDVTAPNLFEANIFTSTNYKNNLFFILSLVGVISALGYNLIQHFENKKYEK